MAEKNKNINVDLDEKSLKNYNYATDRLDQIIDTLKESDTDFDESLKLYEEAVEIGVNSSNYVTENILLDDKINKNTHKEEEAIDDASQYKTTHKDSKLENQN